MQLKSTVLRSTLYKYRSTSTSTSYFEVVNVNGQFCRRWDTGPSAGKFKLPALGPPPALVPLVHFAGTGTIFPSGPSAGVPAPAPALVPGRFFAGTGTPALGPDRTGAGTI